MKNEIKSVENGTEFAELKSNLRQVCSARNVTLPKPFVENRVLLQLGYEEYAESVMPFMSTDMKEYIEKKNWEEIRQELGWKERQLPPAYSSSELKKIQKKFNDKMAEKQGYTHVFLQIKCHLVNSGKGVHNVDDIKETILDVVNENLRSTLEDQSWRVEKLYNDWEIKVIWNSINDIQLSFYFDEDYWAKIYDKSMVYEDWHEDILHIFDENSLHCWKDGIPLSDTGYPNMKLKYTL